MKRNIIDQNCISIKKIIREKLVFYVQNQNEISKQNISIVLKMARTMIINANLSNKLRSETLIIVCYFRNRL